MVNEFGSDGRGIFRPMTPDEKREFINIFNPLIDNEKQVFLEFERRFNQKNKQILKESKDLKNEKLSCQKCSRQAFREGLIDEEYQNAFEKTKTLTFERIDPNNKMFENLTVGGEVRVTIGCHIAYRCSICEFGNAFSFEKLEFTEEMRKLLNEQ